MDRQGTNEFDLAKHTFDLIDRKNRDYAKSIELYEEIAEQIKLLKADMDRLSNKIMEFERIAKEVKYDIRAVVTILQDIATI